FGPPEKNVTLRRAACAARSAEQRHPDDVNSYKASPRRPVCAPSGWPPPNTADHSRKDRPMSFSSWLRSRKFSRARTSPRRTRGCPLSVEPLEDRCTPATIQFLGPTGIGSRIALDGAQDESIVPAASIPDYVIPPIPPNSGFSPTLVNSLGGFPTSVSTYFNVYAGPNSRFFPNSPVVTLDLQPGLSLRSSAPTTTGDFTVGTVGSNGYGSDLTVQILPSAAGEHFGDPVTLILQASFSNLSFGYEPGNQGVGDPSLTMSYSA